MLRFKRYIYTYYDFSLNNVALLVQMGRGLAKIEGLVANACCPNLADGQPNLDFIVDGGYADIKTPVKSS